MRKVAAMAASLVLLAATSVAAQQVYSGTVLRVDPAAGVIVFDDGRMLQTTADTVVISGNQRMMFSSLRQGSIVTVYHGQPVALRDGRYVLLSEAGTRAPGSGTTVYAPPPASSTIVTAPPAAVVTSPPGVVVTAPPAAVVTTPPAAVVTAPPAGAVVYPSTATVVPTFEVSGTVLRADERGQVLTLHDGRKVHLTTDTQVLINGTQPTPLSTLKPGTFVVVRSLRPFWGQRELSPMREVARGTIVRMDQPGVIVLNDGRTIRTTNETVMLVDNRPVTLTTVQPGTRVVIYQDGPATAIVNEPAASPALTVEGGLREREVDKPSF